MTRPFFCDNDHRRAQLYVVYAGTRKKIIVKQIEVYVTDNITPHIIAWDDESKSRKVKFSCACGIVGCGVDFIDPLDYSQGIEIVKATDMQMTKRAFKALIDFTNTGYELSKK